jgi:hypothetical protein
MNRHAFVFVAFLFVDFAEADASPAHSKIELQTKQRTICGFTFAAMKDMIVVVNPIPKDSLQTRVDNERFDVCPYNVELTYKRISIRLDFSRDVTLDRVRHPDDEGVARTAFFRRGENGWEAAGDDITIERANIAIHESERSLALSGLFGRRIQNTQKSDFCFSLDVIGEDKYLTGAVCRSTKGELESVERLFSKEIVIWSE